MIYYVENTEKIRKYRSIFFSQIFHNKKIRFGENSPNLVFMVGQGRIELPTLGFSVEINIKAISHQN
jgi:hypothetical protein